MVGVDLLGAQSVLIWNINENNEEERSSIRKFLLTDQCQLQVILY